MSAFQHFLATKVAATIGLVQPSNTNASSEYIRRYWTQLIYHKTMDARGRFFHSIQNLKQPVEEAFGPLQIVIPEQETDLDYSKNGGKLLKKDVQPQQVTPQPLRDFAAQLSEIAVDETQNQPVAVEVVGEPDRDRRLRYLAQVAGWLSNTEEFAQMRQERRRRRRLQEYGNV